MTRVSVPPVRAAVLGLVADRVGPGPVRVGIDGVDGAGKTRFAGDLEAVLRTRGRSVVRRGLDDHLHPTERRWARGRHDPLGFFLDTYDHDAFRAAVDRDPAPDVLLVDGMFLHSDPLAGCFDLVVFLDVPFAVTAARMAVRDGTPADPDHPRMRRYVEGQRIYFRRCRPAERAGLVVEHTDPATPRVTADRTTLAQPCASSREPRRTT